MGAFRHGADVFTRDKFGEKRFQILLALAARVVEVVAETRLELIEDAVRIILRSALPRIYDDGREGLAILRRDASQDFADERIEVLSDVFGGKFVNF